MRRARPDDIPALVALMDLFYAESGYALDAPLAEKAFADLLADERLGYVWLLDAAGRDAGYVVLTLRFGMEYGGLIACIDDLFVVPEHRNRGLSTAALVRIRDFCRSQGVRAITVEVSPGNGPAQAVYRRIGMEEEPGRQLLALPLERPTHAG
jgi:GNAT superfamily N-acetyltransferase